MVYLGSRPCPLELVFDFMENYGTVEEQRSLLEIEGVSALASLDYSIELVNRRLGSHGT